MSAWRLRLAMALWLAGCGLGARERTRNEVTPAARWHYTLRLHDTLDALEGEICFEGAVPRELRAGKDEAATALRRARWLGPGPVRRLAIERGRIQLEPAADGGCVGYTVSLRESGSLEAGIWHVGRDLVASPNVWLWRPEERASDARATLRLVLPKGVSALVPWPEKDGRYLLDAEAFRFDSYAAFGRFEGCRGEADGVQLDAALLDGPLSIDCAAALRWLDGAVAVARESDGRFPHARLAALIVPTRGDGEPVPFGMVARGGAPSLVLLVSSDAREEALSRDWVLPHELSHLLLPFIERDAAWLSEGFATYYQEVLRARAGIASEQEAMQRLSSALRTAASEGGSTSIVVESARMHTTRAYRRVYWGGAAFWLHADVELRKRTRNHATLDGVLARLRAEARLVTPWSAHALIAHLDELAGQPVFSQALAEAAKQPFPPFEQTLSALGVRAAELALDETAPLAALRRALFSTRRAAR